MIALPRCDGCGQYVSPGPKCSACRRASEERRADPTHHALYRTQAWRKLAASVVAGATRCHHCLGSTPRLVADHVVPIDERPDLAMDPGNVVPACQSCNVRRGRNAKLSAAPDASPRTVGARMAAILEASR